MKLTILGSGTCIPTADRNPAGYVLTIENQQLLFDSGPGTIRRMTEAKIDFRKIDHLFYSHLHLDHVADLFPLLFANKNAFRETPRRSIHLYGPKGFRNFYLTIAQALGTQIISENYQVYLRELMTETISFPGWKISTCLVPHSHHSIAYRIDAPDGASVVYGGDTDFSEELIRLATDCRVLILESAFPENKKVEGHLIPSEAAKMAAASKCEKLVLTHFYPPVNEAEILATAEKYFDGEIIIAKDLMQIVI